MLSFNAGSPSVAEPYWSGQDGLFHARAPMSIHIKTKKLSPRRTDLADQIKVDMLNEIMSDFAVEAKNQLGKLKCEKHPRKVSEITIAADRIHTMKIRRKFCCPEFEKKISAKLEGYLLQ